MKDINKNFYLLLLVLAIAVNFAGINTGFFTDDPGLYAAIAKNLIYKKHFFDLFTYNRDWLDKPHFPFWMIWLSFKTFGISVWAYRLPALLFFLLSMLYTWLFARRYYSREIAFAAALILSTALHTLLSNTDVRAEPYLMALIVGAVYHIARLHERYSLEDLLAAALLTACAIMTKGIFVVAAIYGALLGQLIFKRELREVLKFKWLALGILTIIFIIPELYALYTQFDTHPEKTVFGRHDVSGIKWFLWDSQFGRFVNNGPINRVSPGSKIFFLHTLLWAFAPWCLLFFYSILRNIRRVFRRVELREYYTLSGGLILLLLFSLSGFQLPFYTNAVFPLFAIITAPLFFDLSAKAEIIFRKYSQWAFIVLLPVAVLLLNYILKPDHLLWLWVDMVLSGLLVFFIATRTKAANVRLLFLSCIAALFTGFYLNAVFYKQIVPYKGQIAAARFINNPEYKGFHIYSLKFENNIFQFYCDRPVDFMPIDQFVHFDTKEPSVFFVSQPSLDYLRQQHAAFTIMKSFITYPQENLTPKFLNKASRAEALGHVYLITKD
ncbi:MAG TPA: glycosyltransferase family 39 protein [Mucilaginibacter sp.]|nr:glycosyltransferase family 39 protein [Mucilaginibacter sp.]